MSIFAKIQKDIVIQVIIADQDYIDTLQGTYIETWENPGENQRYNYASIGGVYDRIRDAFIPVKFFPSWVFNEETCRWDAPIEIPASEPNVNYFWDEPTTSWKEIT